MKFKTTDLPDLMHIMKENTDAEKVLNQQDIADAWTKYFSAKEGEQVKALVNKFELLFVDVHNSIFEAFELIEMHMKDVNKKVLEDNQVLLTDDYYIQLPWMLYQYMILFSPQVEEGLIHAPDHLKNTLKIFKKSMAKRMKQVIKEASN